MILKLYNATCFLLIVDISDFPFAERKLVRVKRIIGGHHVRQGDYPWAASIQARRFRDITVLFRRNVEHYCGAVLIAPRWILTAAHCLYTEDEDGNLISYLDPKMWHVRLARDSLRPSIVERVKGLWSRMFNYVFGHVKLQTFYHVKEIFHHPKYVPGTLEYDLALLQLKEEPILRKIKNIGLIALPSKAVGQLWPHTNQTCLSVGWGCSFADGPPTMKIQSVELPVLDPETCRNMYSAYINLTIDHEFCAGYHMGNKGICPGDSGGPLVCRSDDGDLKLAGIVSATHSKYPADFPAIFTRVSYFVDWIHQVMDDHPTEPNSGPLSFLRLHN
ncbi:Subfamily S1A unassigned peptidase S01 family [Fasciolopsis buskii]|uniref:Subfamily S1A unassigned peptidase S01 family n=1 Tax=Fasciolopsis buskii TaxID=27845 RepID=A0A8E0VKQ5_9TREM|nr:Subfamily S1A unassigned peptidase S01 family [Fasciolopsis buski]